MPNWATVLRARAVRSYGAERATSRSKLLGRVREGGMERRAGLGYQQARRRKGKEEGLGRPGVGLEREKEKVFQK